MKCRKEYQRHYYATYMKITTQEKAAKRESYRNNLAETGIKDRSLLK